MGMRSTAMLAIFFSCELFCLLFIIYKFCLSLVIGPNCLSGYDEDKGKSYREDPWEPLHYYTFEDIEGKCGCDDISENPISFVCLNCIEACSFIMCNCYGVIYIFLWMLLNVVGYYMYMMIKSGFFTEMLGPIMTYILLGIVAVFLIFVIVLQLYLVCSYKFGSVFAAISKFNDDSYGLFLRMYEKIDDVLDFLYLSEDSEAEEAIVGAWAKKEFLKPGVQCFQCEAKKKKGKADGVDV